jgi:hypothetical protein
MREFINPAVSRAGLGSCRRRHGVSDLGDFIPALESEQPAIKKTFKNYEPGCAHIDIKYLAQMPDETSSRYLSSRLFAQPVGSSWKSIPTNLTAATLTS